MESLVVGEEGCAIKDIVDVFFNEVNSVTVFSIWKDFARELQIQPYLIEEWSRDTLLKILTVKDVLHNILTSWKTEKGKDASLINLLKHLDKLSLKNVADDLMRLFSTTNRVYRRGGELYKLTLPNKPNYYIPRTLITRNIINVKVFSSTQNDVFVLHGKGIDRHRLSQLAKKELTDTSLNQVRKQELSVRFILLVHFGDWALLCRKTKYPIHLLKHHEGRFHWICTNGDISALQEASDEKSQNEFSEDEFIREIETDLQFQTNQPICLSDSPGMGKSLLLANIGRQLQQMYPQRLIAFIVISELVVKIRAQLSKIGNKVKAVLQALVQILCENNLAREQLVQKITTANKKPSTEVDLMVDGFDEVSIENVELAHECLEILKTNFNCAIRVLVTTRPQHLHELEKRLSVLGHNIRAFQEKHQIEFLTSYWNNQEVNLDGGKLKVFSRNCLSTLKKKLNKKDEDIAGIPLQCMMIAEVYMKEAHLFCDSKNKNLPESATSIDINSIADLYEKTILHKIGKFIETYPLVPELINCILPWHMYLGLDLIFPSLAPKFMDILQIDSGLKLDYLVNIGILECRGIVTKDSVHFIHRTFAEYLAARFFVTYVIGPGTANFQNASKVLPNVLFQHVLECSVQKRQSWETSTYYKCSFKHSILCHFLNALLGSQTHTLTENCISLKSTNYMKVVTYACIHSDFGNIIAFVRGLKYPEGFCVSNIYIDFGILIDGTAMASLDLLKFVLQNFKHEPVTAIKENVTKLHSALHAAVRRGSYLIFEYILKEHNFEDLVKEDNRFLNLVYWTVKNTTEDDPEKIQDRVQIITTLCGLNRQMINYCVDYHKRAPLLAPMVVNIQLLTKLIEYGANLLNFDGSGNTILHNATNLSPTDYYDLLQFIPIQTLKSLLQMHNKYNEPSFHLIVKRGLATPNILNLILSNGVDINLSGKRGYTCIFYALDMKNEDRIISTVKLLLENGADHTRVCSNGDSVLHYSAEKGRIDCLRFFLEEKNMNVNQINELGDTPIFNALLNFNSYSALSTVQFLLDQGADYKICNSNQNNLIHYTAYGCHMECLELFISLGGLDINQPNEDGDTPLLYALREYHMETLEMIMMLLDKGADHTITNKEGNNFLHRLAEIVSSECFSHFAGIPSIEVNARNCHNDTPLHLLLRKIDNYDFCVNDFSSFLHNIEGLLSLGADVKAKNKDGDTPLDVYRREILKWQNEEDLMKKDLTIRSLLQGSVQQTRQRNYNQTKRIKTTDFGIND